LSDTATVEVFWRSSFTAVDGYCHKFDAAARRRLLI